MSTRGGGGRGAGRGVGRGRSRGAGVTDTRRPGEPPQGPTQAGQQQVGRGRGRAAPQIQQQKQQQLPPQATVTEATVKVSQMTVQDVPQLQQTKTERQPQTGSQTEKRKIWGTRAEEELMTKPMHIDDKKGVTGNPVPLATNHIMLKSRTGKAIYQYYVEYNPPVDARGLRRYLLKQHKEAVLGNVFSFDGMILHLPHRLPDQVTELASQSKEGENYRITVKLTNELSANSPVCLQLFNILFRSVLKTLGLQQIGRHYYNSKVGETIPQHRLELWPGFITSILQYEKSIMLCADISHKILRMDTVLDLFYDLKERERNFHDACCRAVIGEIVLTRYNNRTYRVDDIDWNKTPSSTFTTADGSEISFITYYKKQYDIVIKDHGQPLLISQPRKKDEQPRRGRPPVSTGPTLLVPELCCRTGLSEEARADFRIMKDVAIYTRQDPSKRVGTLNKFLDQLNTNPEVTNLLGGWNLEFDQSLYRFQGRVLPPEKIFQQNANFSYKPQDADWSREMRGTKVISPVSLKSYIILFTRRDSGLAEDFIMTLKRVGPPMGINIADPVPVELQNDRTDSFLQGIERNIEKHTQMVICLLPQNRKDRYDAIKKKCCVDNPVPSQCIVSRTVMKKQQLMSVATKICLQLNCKLGGELWALEIPMKSLMVIGIDTYHDSASKGRSVGGFIASMNQTLTRYYSQTMFQHTGQELADNLKTCMTAALRKYHEINKALPQRIVVYRDGVGDGQLPVVLDFELPQLKAAFGVVPDYKPKFACVVVKKRINARFFLDSRSGYSNPIPGTIIDSDVTKPNWYDFYLVSQSVRQGTVTPTHFNVVEDSSGLKPDHMQRLTYKLTHLYYNWPGTVRVPAPCQYAHKLAFLVGQSIHTDPSPEISDRLYFL